jgi:imidazolonepropionase-like amidohydrolase
MRCQDCGTARSCHRCPTVSGSRPRRHLAVSITMLACAALGAPAAHAQLLQRPLALEHARILTMDGPVVENGTLLIKGEKIVAVGAGVKVPILAAKVDARGGTVSPGLIDALSALGAGDSAGPASGYPGAGPTRRAEDAFDRYDTAALVDALRNGVTAIYLPAGGSAGICGTGAVLRLAPGPVRDESYGRVLGREAALCVDLGSAGTAVARLKTLAAVRKQFLDALEYRRSLEEYEEKLTEYKKNLKEGTSKKEPPKKEPAKKEEKPTSSVAVDADNTDQAEQEEKKKEEAKPAEAKKEEDTKPKKPPRPPRNPALSLLLKAVDRELPVRVLAHRSEDILNALELAKEFHLDLILDGATEAHLVASQIADAEVPVVLGSMALGGVRRDDPFRRATRESGAVLSAAGVRWVVGSGGRAPSGGWSAAGARFVAFNAQLAAAHNRADDPLKGITADAADALRVGGQIGRLRPGLLADFVLWSADPADPAAKVVRVYVGGDLVYQAPDEAKKGETK